MIRQSFRLLVNFFRELFIILPRQATIDLSGDITFFSKRQTSEISVGIEKDLIQSACGIFCIQMVMSFYHRTVPILQHLSSELVHAQAFSIERGLVLAKTNKVLHKYGFCSKVYKYISCKVLFHYLIRSIPVIASVAGDQGGHFVVLTGVSIEGGQIKKVFYLDPNNLVSNSSIVTLDEWQTIFNKRALVMFSNLSGF